MAEDKIGYKPKSRTNREKRYLIKPKLLRINHPSFHFFLRAVISFHLSTISNGTFPPEMNIKRVISRANSHQRYNNRISLPIRDSTKKASEGYLLVNIAPKMVNIGLITEGEEIKIV